MKRAFKKSRMNCFFVHSSYATPLTRLKKILRRKKGV
jgi:hypothetical protein